MRRLVWSVLACAVVVAVVWAAEFRTTDIYRFENGLETDSISSFSGTTQNSALTLPENSVGGTELSGIILNVIYCGEATENGTTYLGPSTAQLGGNGADLSIGSTACDALENTTEATADTPLLANVAHKIMGLYCKTDGTLGSGETIVFTARAAAADTVPAISITLTEGAAPDGRVLTGSTTDIAGGATRAIQAVMTSNNADGDNFWCLETIALQ